MEDKVIDSVPSLDTSEVGVRMKNRFLNLLFFQLIFVFSKYT